MKFMNSRLGRKFKTIVAICLLVVVAVGAQSYTILAAETLIYTELDDSFLKKPNMDVQTFEFEVGPENTPKAANSTTYFIDDQEFSFTSYNLGREFYIPKTCNCRMMVAVAAEDRRSEDITINIRYSTGGTTHSQRVATNKAAVYVLNNVGGGGHNLEYIGRNNVKYKIRISLYTWDY